MIPKKDSRAPVCFERPVRKSHFLVMLRPDCHLKINGCHSENGVRINSIWIESGFPQIRRSLSFPPIFCLSMSFIVQNNTLKEDLKVRVLHGLLDDLMPDLFLHGPSIEQHALNRLKHAKTSSGA